MKLTYPPQKINVEKRKDGTLILSSPLKLEEAEVNIAGLKRHVMNFQIIYG